MTVICIILCEVQVGLLKSIISNFVKDKNSNVKIQIADQIKKYDGINMSSLVVYAPTNLSELNKVIDCVSSGQAVIINFENIKKSEFQNMADYLSGALYTMRAKISRLQNQLYVIMPKSIKLATL